MMSLGLIGMMPKIGKIIIKHIQILYWLDMTIRQNMCIKRIIMQHQTIL